MRIAVISDIHSNIHALEAVLADIDTRDVETIYCLGDVVGYAAFPNEVIALLRERAVVVLKGNYDEAVGEELLVCGCDFADEEAARLGFLSVNWSIDNTNEANRAWLRSLPSQLLVEIEGKRVLMVHGSPRRNNEYLHSHLDDETLWEAIRDTDCDVLLCGHTHKSYHRVVNNRHVLNPGSVGKPKHGNSNASYGLVTVTTRGVTLTSVEVLYPIHSAQAAILQAGLPPEFARALGGA